MLSLTSAAAADAGYFVGEKGAHASGRGGAVTVDSGDPTALSYNPASLALTPGTELVAGNRFGYHTQTFRREPTLDFGNTQGGVPPYVEFAEVENETPWQVFEPLLALASDFGLPNFRLALSAMAPPGISQQRFQNSGAQRYMMVSRKAELLNYSVGGAFRPHPDFACGLSLTWIQLRKLEYQLVVDGNSLAGQAHPVSSELDLLATLSGSDPFALNARVGAWYRPLTFLELGVSGQVLPAELTSKSRLELEPLSPAVDEDVELTRAGRPANDVTLRLPLPLTLRSGARYIHERAGQSLFDVELDVVLETWSRVEAFEVDSNGLVATLREQPVSIDRIRIEKRWRNTLGLGLGGDYRVLPEMVTLRAGLNWQSPLSSAAYANVDFPSGARFGGALGASIFIAGGVELAIAYQQQRQTSVRVSEGEARVFQQVPGSACQPPYDTPETCHPAYLGRPAPAVNAGRYSATSHMGSIDVLYRF